MTICFHVDNWLSHRVGKANDLMIKCILQEYDSIFEDGSGNMSESWGKVHEYLGITLYYTVNGKLRITMFSYIEEILTAFDKEDPKGKVAKSSSAPNNIFVVNEDCRKLDKFVLWSSKI